MNGGWCRDAEGYAVERCDGMGQASITKNSQGQGEGGQAQGQEDGGGWQAGACHSKQVTALKPPAPEQGSNGRRTGDRIRKGLEQQRLLDLWHGAWAWAWALSLGLGPGTGGDVHLAMHDSRHEGSSSSDVCSGPWKWMGDHWGGRASTGGDWRRLEAPQVGC